MEVLEGNRYIEGRGRGLGLMEVLEGLGLLKVIEGTGYIGGHRGTRGSILKLREGDSVNWKS